MVAARHNNSLFGPWVATRPHVAYQRLRDSEVHADARRLMHDVFGRMEDPDGNFVSDFQGPGFHSRLFELGSFAYLDESGWIIERPRGASDFLVTKGDVTAAVEAVTLNPRQGRDADIAASQLPNPPDDNMVAKCSDELPIRLEKTLFDKLRRRYWHRPRCRGLPFVILLGAFHEPGSTMYIDASVARYLFGVDSYGSAWIEKEGILVREVPVGTHSFGGRTIPSDFFASDAAENVSAIIWSNRFTISTFFRVAAGANGLPCGVEAVEVKGVCAGVDGLDSAESYNYWLGDPEVPRETWSRGLTLFVNPNARVPLPDEMFNRTSTFRVRNGRLVQDVHGFHPLTCITRILGRRTA